MTTQAPWLSFHVYYNSDPFWLLTEAVLPVITRAKRNGLLSNYFFIRYWEKGEHIRLRVRSTDIDVTNELAEHIETAVLSFISQRPSMVEPQSRFMAERWTKQFIDEYGQAPFSEKYQVLGKIPYQKNNSVVIEPYEPEYRRYGGHRGIKVAEDFFQRSSDIALAILSGPNGKAAGLKLAGALKLFIYLCETFLSREQATAFCEQYRLAKSYPGQAHFYETANLKYQRQRQRLTAAMTDCGTIASDPKQARSPYEANCLSMIAVLKADLPGVDLNLIEGELPIGVGKIGLLLLRYFHMHCNRLGLNVLDEAYIAYLVNRALEEDEQI